MLQKKLNNVRYTWDALVRMWREERSFRIQMGSTIPFLALAAFLKVSTLEWSVMLFVFLLLIALEFVNTAFERLGDAVTTEHDSHIGNAKELASAAVFVTGLGVAVIFAIILIPHLIDSFTYF